MLILKDFWVIFFRFTFPSFILFLSCLRFLCFLSAVAQHSDALWCKDRGEENTRGEKETARRSATMLFSVPTTKERARMEGKEKGRQGKREEGRNGLVKDRRDENEKIKEGRETCKEEGEVWRGRKRRKDAAAQPELVNRRGRHVALWKTATKGHLSMFSAWRHYLRPMQVNAIVCNDHNRNRTFNITIHAVWEYQN